ncbi:hypothetical protein [Herbiconiux sp. A18JL235]|uniref:Hydroxymethylpyrimidine pyrophosphatase-like HAD family hydrolase n=1 Tax=Herbiconiux sp. A18JL235 TaxID=3152363 RepID=A0AB39BF15_9MICO
MTSPTPSLGLLLDVDGPLASPVTRSLAIPSIAEDLVVLANAGVPVVFNTGRSDGFLVDEVVGPLLSEGLEAGARVYGVCEKGATWFPITSAGAGELVVDSSLVLPTELRDAVRALVSERFDDVVFFDETKRTGFAVEQHLDVDSLEYLARQDEIDRALLDLCTADGDGAVWRTERRPAADGSTRYRLDPSIISTDIEDVRVGKALGAERGLALIAADGPLPKVWRTAGDSRGDYAMADWLFEHAYEVAHVDVRPAEGVPDKPYPVLTAPDDLVNDAAGALFLRRWVADVVTAGA